MRKLNLLLIVLLSFFAFALASCGDKKSEEPTPDTNTNPNDTNLDESDEIDLSQIEFNTKDVAFTGFTSSIECTNVPEGLTVEYEGNNVSEVGSHKVIAYIKNAEGEEVQSTPHSKMAFTVDCPFEIKPMSIMRKKAE